MEDKYYLLCHHCSPFTKVAQLLFSLIGDAITPMLFKNMLLGNENQ